MNVNMNNIRSQLISAVNDLGAQIQGQKADIYRDEYDDLAEAFDEVAQIADILLCIYYKGDDGFNDISKKYSAIRLSEEDDD